MKVVDWICYILLFIFPIISMAQPVVNLGPDTTICGSYTLDAANTGATFLWSTGESLQTITVDSTAVYWVDVTDMNGTIRDSVYVIVQPIPSIILQPIDSFYCGGFKEIISASTSGNVIWTDSSANVLGVGDTLNYNIQSDVTLYYQASALTPVLTPVGLQNFTSGAYFNSGQNGRGVVFDVFEQIRLEYVWISIDNGPFTATIELLDGANMVVYSTNINLSSAGNHKIILGYDIPVGSGYTLKMNAINGGKIYCQYPFSSWSGLTYPFLSMTTGVVSNVYSFFYNWGVSLASNGVCSSSLDSVHLGLLPTPVVDLGQDTVVCGDSLILDATFVGVSVNYIWSTLNTSNTISANSTGQYSVTVVESGSCSSSDSIFLTLQTQPLIIYSPQDTTICGGAIPIIASPNTGNVIWQDSIGEVLGVGDTLHYNLQNDVTLYYHASAKTPVTTTVGLPDFTGGTYFNSGQNGRGVVFDVFQQIRLEHVWISVDNGPFTATIELLDGSNTVLYTTNINLSSSGNHKVILEFDIPVGNAYTLKMSAITGGNIYCQFPFSSWNTLTYPFLSMTTGVVSNVYSFFYNWGVSLTPNGICKGSTDSVSLVVLPTPSIDLGSDTVICGDSLSLDATYSGMNISYLWNTTSTSSVITADSSGKYTVTVTENGDCFDIDSINLTFYTQPIITSFPADTSLCVGVVPIISSLNTGNIIWEDSLGNLLGVGDTLHYDLQNDITLYYQASEKIPITTSVGLTDFSGGGYYNSGQNGRGIKFDVFQDLRLEHVWISVDNGPFTSTIELLDGSNTVLNITNVNVPSAGNHKVILGFDIPVGTNYTLRMTAISGGNIYCQSPFSNWGSLTYPFLDMTTGVVASVYSFFYNWGISLTPNGFCESTFDSVSLLVLPTPKINIGVDTIICGDSLLLDGTYIGSGITYFWSNSSTDPTTYATSTGEYSLTVTENNICSDIDTINLEFFTQPFITSLLNDTSYCRGNTEIISASNFGSIYWEEPIGNIIALGDTLNYDMQDTTILYYKASNLIPVNSTVGLSTFSGGNFFTAQNGKGIQFDVLQDLRLHYVWIKVDNGPFSGTIELQDNNNNTIYSTLVNLPSSGEYKIELDYDIQIGTGYTLYMFNITGGGIYCQFPFSSWNSLTYPFLDMTTGVAPTVYSFFYNWEISLTPNGACESTYDSVILDLLPTPEVDLQEDTIACGDTLIIDVFYPGASYLWGNTGFTTSSITITQEGFYEVSSTIGICNDSDSINVYLNSPPSTLVTSQDTTTCAGFIERKANYADYYAWYTDSVGGNLIGQGNPFMYDAQVTDTIWVEGQNYSNKYYLQGLTDTFVTSNAAYFYPVQQRGLIFDVHENIRLKTVAIYVEDGDLLLANIELRDYNGVLLNSLSINASSGENIINLDFDILKGQDYQLVLTNFNTAGVLVETPFSGFPIVGDQVTIKSSLYSSNYYRYFYKWNVQTLSCPSERQPSIVNVLPTPIIDFPVDSIICGDTLFFDASGTGASTFLWSTGDTSSLIIIDSSQTLSLTGSLGNCTVTDDVNVFIIQPPDIIIPPTDTTVCQGTHTLYASGNAAYYAWYDSLNSTVPFAVGDSVLIGFHDSTTLWVEGTGFILNSLHVGANYNSSSNLNYYDPIQTTNKTNRYLEFDINSPIILNSVSLYADTVTTATLTIKKYSFPIFTKSISLNALGENIISIDTILDIGNYTIELSNNAAGGILVLQPFSNLSQLNTSEISFIQSYPSGQYPCFFDWRISTPSCATERRSVRVDVPINPPIRMVSDTATCLFSTITLDPIGYDSLYTYLWDDFSTADTLLVDSSGYYGVTVTYDGKCSSEKDVFVQFLSTPNNPGVTDTSICSSRDIQLGPIVNDGIMVWYDSSNLGETVYLSSPQNIYVSDTTNFWFDVAPKATTRLGRQSFPNPNIPISYSNFTVPNEFDVHQYAILDSVALYVETAPATIEIKLEDSTTILNSTTFTILDAKQKVFVPLNYLLPPGNNYELVFSSFDTKILQDTSKVAYYTSSANIATVKGKNNIGYFSNFFDWHFTYAFPDCHSLADTFTVSVNMPVDLVDSLHTCDTIQVDISDSSILSYQWSNGLTTGMVMLSDAGVYAVTISDGATCTVVDSMFLTIPIPLSFPNDTSSCDFTVFTNYSSSQATFLWDTGDSTPYATIPHIGLYGVTVTTNEGCVLIDTVEIKEIVQPPTPDLGSSYSVCFSDTLDAGHGGENMSYLWNTDDTTQQIIVDSTGFYSVVVTSPLGCSGQSYVNVTIDTAPYAYFIITSKNDSTLEIACEQFSSLNGPNQTHYWDMGDSSPYYPGYNLFHTYQDTGCYKLSLVVSSDCGVDTFSMLIGVGVPDTSCAPDTTVAFFHIKTLSDLGFQVFPNPNDGQFKLQLSSKIEEESLLSLYDINGRVLFNKRIPLSQQLIWDVSTPNLPTGIYFVRLVNSQQSKTRRVMILRE
ncbi:MAG: T9SS type A sorting domain-containing protein [Saprospiraceae bacterium]|nr:T9SS type A sorting domain-containing protein [Saprospiraceae bacterium]